MYYKAPDNSLHFLDDTSFEHLLPAGSVKIDDKEVKILQFKPTALTYAELRHAEYPPITDYLDGVVKSDQAQIDAYIEKCKAVKAKYPKSQ